MDMDAEAPQAAAASRSRLTSTGRVVAAASVGTVFEWYDFALYGSLAAVLAKKFFAGVDPTTGFIFALLTFAAGFIMRPFGAVVFGRIGDMVGRKKTFLITIVIMGLSTVGVGFLPDYGTVGIAAPITLVSLRMLQGLALGGEYGGAAIYVAEHSPPGRRGLNTSWIVSTGTLGLLLSFGLILLARALTGDAFEDWGWRLPFVFSLPMLAMSVWIRRQMDESPSFQMLKAKQRLSRAPLSEALLDRANLKRIMLAFGLCAGQTCVYYAAALYPTFFLTQVLKVDPTQVNTMVVFATIAAIPFFALVGWLCDRIGRRPVLIAAYLLSLCAYLPVYHAFTHNANRALEAAQERNPVVVEADPQGCSFLFNPVGTRKFTNPCDIARQALASSGVSYSVAERPGATAVVRVGGRTVDAYDANGLPTAEAGAKAAAFNAALRAQLDAAGYPAKADPKDFNAPMIFLLLLVPMILAIASITPIPALLVELFPTRIRYTSMSVPYHFAAGWIGGLLPTVIFALSTLNGNIYFGLWYPIAWTALSLVVCLVFLKETKDVDINADL
ncbi:MFS transporter [Azospirillum canadense]|uniref:MFS transporter n=1 Tax=Azospirillum canadense TaxID=403962 RepID=UPI002225FE44|nr:MFS transporter [Azospirillum canadense]MCW2241804.1 MFS family permease [Azospirillum canadense]